MKIFNKQFECDFIISGRKLFWKLKQKAVGN